MDLKGAKELLHIQAWLDAYLAAPSFRRLETRS